MFDWKLLVTIIIIFGILLALTSTQPAVKNFFSSIDKKIVSGNQQGSEAATITPGNVEFSLEIEKTDFSAKTGNVTIGIESKQFSAKIEKSDISTESPIVINGFSGSIAIAEKVTLDGTLNSFSSGETKIGFDRASLKTESPYDKITIENLGIAEYKTNATGTLIVKGNEIKVNSPLTIKSLLGNFVFEGEKIKITGRADKISIPDIGLSVG